jgi:hypothetical protein
MGEAGPIERLGGTGALVRGVGRGRLVPVHKVLLMWVALSGCASAPVTTMSLAERCLLDRPADWHEIREPPPEAVAIAKTLQPDSILLQHDSRIHWLANAGKLAVCWKSPREPGRCGGTSVELISVDGRWQADDMWNVGICMG